MKHYFQTARTYVIAHKKDFTIGAGVFVGLALVAGLIVLIVANIDRPAEIVYKPVRACDLFTLDEAKELIGSNAFRSTEDADPVLQGNAVTSSCGYSDGNANIDDSIVAAIKVRSGINDDGIEENKNDFQRGIPDEKISNVPDLGDSAYFNQVNGQLNILNGLDWIIISYGVNSDPAGNTVDQAVALAKKIIN